MYMVTENPLNADWFDMRIELGYKRSVEYDFGKRLQTHVAWSALRLT